MTHSKHQQKAAALTAQLLGFESTEELVAEILQMCAYKQGETGAFYQEIAHSQSSEKLAQEWLEEIREQTCPSRD